MANPPTRLLGKGKSEIPRPLCGDVTVNDVEKNHPPAIQGFKVSAIQLFHYSYAGFVFISWLKVFYYYRIICYPSTPSCTSLLVWSLGLLWDKSWMNWIILLFWIYYGIYRGSRRKTIGFFPPLWKNLRKSKTALNLPQFFGMQNSQKCHLSCHHLVNRWASSGFFCWEKMVNASQDRFRIQNEFPYHRAYKQCSNHQSML